MNKQVQRDSRYWRGWQASLFGECAYPTLAGRRAGIELRRNGVDADVVAAGEMVGKYQRSLTSV